MTVPLPLMQFSCKQRGSTTRGRQLDHGYLSLESTFKQQLRRICFCLSHSHKVLRAVGSQTFCAQAMDWVDWPFRAVREDKSNVTDQKPVKLSKAFVALRTFVALAVSHPCTCHELALDRHGCERSLSNRTLRCADLPLRANMRRNRRVCIASCALQNTSNIRSGHLRQLILLDKEHDNPTTLQSHADTPGTSEHLFCYGQWPAVHVVLHRFGTVSQMTLRF